MTLFAASDEDIRIRGMSGSGKTTLIEQLIRASSTAVSSIDDKHAHTASTLINGQGSYRHRQAGCSEVMVVSDRRWVIMHELRASGAFLEDQIERISPCDCCSLRTQASSSAEAQKSGAAKTASSAASEDGHIVATPPTSRSNQVAEFDLDDYDDIGDFILSYNGFR